MLYEFVPKKLFGFEKYLVALCMLISMHAISFAQPPAPGTDNGDYTFLKYSEGTPIKAGIISVEKGTTITLSISGTVGMPPTVDWKFRTAPKPAVGDNKETLVGENSNSITVTVDRDIEFQATYNYLLGGKRTDRILISCVSLTADETLVCPGTSIKFEAFGGQFAKTGYFERKEGSRWTLVKQFSIDSKNDKQGEIYALGDKDFSFRAVFTYGDYYDHNNDKSSVTNEVDIKIRTDCKSKCLTTSTGDYYVGTDFDPSNSDPHVIPNDIVSHFGDYNIDLLEGDLKAGDYWLGTDVEGFFGQVPYNDMVAGVGGKNNYLFCQNPNQRICELKFSPVSEFVGQFYKYKMRLYLQKERDCDIDQNAKFKARTGQGKVTVDHLYGAAYRNSDGSLIREAEGFEEGDMTLAFAQLINQEDIKDYDMIKVEIVFDGQFPLDEKFDPVRNQWNGLTAFSFMPEFAQMKCWKVALDYISAEIENVCLSPDILCAGDYTTAHAAGFPEKSDFRWYRKDGDNLIDVTGDVKHPNGKPEDAYIKAEVGKVTYQLQVNIPGVGKRIHDFVVTGNDCGIVPPTEINGGTFCMPNSGTYSNTYEPNTVDLTASVSYEWSVYKPATNGEEPELWFNSKTKPDPHFNVYSSFKFRDETSPYYSSTVAKNDSLVITMDSNDATSIEEGDYELVLKVLNNNSEKAELKKTIHIYRNPNITLKLLGDKFEGASSESDKTICPSDRRREIIASAENAFDSPYLSNYEYVWNSIPGSDGVFTPVSTDPSKAIVNLGAIPGICDGAFDYVEFTVQAYLDGCSDDDKNKYNLDALGEISIDCNSLIGKKDTFDVAPKRDDADLTNANFPIPDFKSGCDTDPKIIIDITPIREGVTLSPEVSHIEVYKSEIATSPLLNITLLWGEYDFHYTVEDGCGRQKDCHASIFIEKGKPSVPCDQILDIDTEKGNYNELTSNKCSVKFDDLNLTVPVLPDLNDKFETPLTGNYEGRQHFDSKQDKNGLNSDRSKFDKTIPLEADYDINYTYILWSFTNAAGKTTYCVQEVLVEDKDLPDFDCDQIKPFRPVTKKGECTIEFKDFKDELMSKNYYAHVYCPEPGYSVLGELHNDSLKDEKVLDDRVFSVGIKDTIYWQFRVRHDYGDNVKYCPQEINAFAGDTIAPDCDAIAYREGLAEEGTCEVDASKIDIPSPTAVEPCTGIIVPGVGTRSDNKELVDPYPTGDTYITWVFKGENSFPDTCVTHVFVKGNKHFDKACDVWFPNKNIVVPDCDQTDVPLEPRKIQDPCVVGYDAPSEPYLTQYVVNSADPTKMDTIFTPIDLETENPYHFPQVGEWFVSWVFWDYTHNISDTCVQSIHLKDNKPPIFNCDKIEKNDSMYVTLNGKCSIPFKDLRDSLGYYDAIEACTGDKIPGVPYLYDPETKVRSEFPKEVSVGIYKVIWVFANDSLTTEETTCIKTLNLQHNMEPVFDCNKLKNIQLFTDGDSCAVALNENNLPIPEAYDPCVIDYIVYGHGYIQLFETGEYQELCYFDREKNKIVYVIDSLPLGGHKIKWVFNSPFSTKEKICYQTIKINSGIFEKIDCNDLASTVHLTLMKQGDATYQELVDAGLIKPTFEDPCNVIDTLFYRSDDLDKDGVGPSIYDNYSLGVYDITWKFWDKSPNAEREKECHTRIEIVDGDNPPLGCPTISKSFVCLEELLADPNSNYATFDEFLAAGGSLISNNVDVSPFVDPNSFKCDTMSLGDKCDYTFIRKFSITNLRGQVATCEQRIPIKDTEAPVWGVSLTAGVRQPNGELQFNSNYNCSKDVTFPDDLFATDMCQDNKIDQYRLVSSFDDVKDGLFYTVTSDRSSNPADCKYYSYNETRKYVAVDRCSNKSEVLSYVANVSAPTPTVNLPALKPWTDKFLPAVSRTKNCEFLCPDIVSDFPTDVINDGCDNESVKYLKIWQSPAAGDVITKQNNVVTVYIEHPCGLQTTVTKDIYVQDRSEIISIDLATVTVCAEKEFSVNDFVDNKGFLYEQNWFKPGTYQKKDNSVFYYDYYKGINKDQLESLSKTMSKSDLDANYLIYSNNIFTHPNKYDLTLSSKLFIGLDSLSDDGLYTIVGMDTSMHCTDTTTAYITVHSKPSITLDASPYTVCEKDSIHLISDEETLFDKFNVFIADNGEIVEDTAHGWMLNGNKYEPETKLDYVDGLIKMQYYAENACGQGISSDWIPLSIKERMNPDNLMLTTAPNNPSRVYLGESAKLNLITKYSPTTYMWYRVKGVVDGNSDEMFDRFGNVRDDYKDSNFEQDSLLAISKNGDIRSKSMDLEDLGDSAKYYVLLVDEVCPAVPSNIVAIDVVTKLPTAFTPHNSIGMNDIFMEGHKVVIFNRYGQKMEESDNGWDGTCRGELVDPGVYFYEVVINNNQRVKGSIEVVYFK